jgi:hypothetical protein
LPQACNRGVFGDTSRDVDIQSTNTVCFASFFTLS